MNLSDAPPVQDELLPTTASTLQKQLGYLKKRTDVTNSRSANCHHVSLIYITSEGNYATHINQ